MYVVAVEVKDSPIHGKGVFAKQDIKAGEVVWGFKDGHDIKMAPEEYAKLPAEQKAAMEKTGYLSPTSGMWVFPPAGDPACYTNHSQSNNLSTKFDPKFSDEPYFVANRDIKPGEELTNNYLEFDEVSKNLKTNWLKNT